MKIIKKTDQLKVKIMKISIVISIISYLLILLFGLYTNHIGGIAFVGDTDKEFNMTFLSLIRWEEKINYIL